MPQPPPTPIPGLRGVFTTASAARDGWSRAALMHAVTSERIVRLHRAIYVSRATWEATGSGAAGARLRFAILSAAAVTAVRGSVASHLSAAVLAGLPTWGLPDRPCVTVRPRYTGDAIVAHLHRATLPSHHVDPLARPATTTAARFVVDVAREHRLEDAVVVGDAALHQSLVDAADLSECLAFCATWPGAARAAGALPLLDGRSESPLESVSRIRLVACGIPAPETQVDICSPDGRFLGRLDFYWRQFGVGGEVDGREKYRDRPEDTLWTEKLRHGALSETGLTIVRWERSDLEMMPVLRARLERAFARAATVDRDWIARPSRLIVPPRLAS